MSKNLHCFSCENEDCLGPPKYKCDQALACFESELRYGDGRREIRRGCLDRDDFVQLTCSTKIGRPPGSAVYNGYCCKKDFCNMNLTTLTEDDSNPNTGYSENYLNKYIFSVCIDLIAVLAIICLIWRICKCWRCRCRSFDIESDCNYEEKDPVNNYTDNTDTSGSGFGLPLLMSRTIAQEVTFFDCIYKSKSSEVWEGKWCGHNVAIKKIGTYQMFCTRDANSHERELEVYKVLNTHENILPLIGAVCTPSDSGTQQLLITVYCELGSLYDYLNRYTLEYKQCLNILIGIIRGLDYLHSETIKKGIAHRDIKTKNILMRDCNSVCIADFGLAVIHDKENGKIIYGEKYKVGTIRYMSPEILSDSFKENDFSSHKMSDIYSLGLVMWEVIRRCKTSDGKVDEYSLPYGGIVPNNPSFEDMKKVVCIDEQRPSISSRISCDHTLAKVVAIIKECWNTNQ